MEKVQGISIKDSAKWYILQVIPGYEEKAKDFLDNKNFDNDLLEIFIPHYSYKTKTGKMKKKSLYPGYIFIKSVMDDDSWYTIRNTQFVTGIVGSTGRGIKPVPLSEEKIMKIFSQIKVAENELINGSYDDTKEEEKIIFYEGELVEVISGPFKGKKGKISEIIREKNEAKVDVEMFGRLVPTAISLVDLEKSNK